ncbi:MAG: SLBB domain-containing protein [Rhodothermia bacterium]
MQIYTLEFNLKPRMNLALVRHVVMAAFIIGAAFLALSSEVRGQNRSLMDIYGSSTDDDSNARVGRSTNDVRKQSEQQAAMALYPPLEGAVDPETYVVGPNDQFTVTVGGPIPTVSAMFVSADGVLVFPSVGRIEAAGRTLAEVEAEARNLLGSSFSNVLVDISLSRPREFWVHVTGAVPQPGRYLSLPVGRLEDVLKQAFLLGRVDIEDPDPAFRPALRNVGIKHRDGSEDSYDLVKYYRTGDIASNPYLLDGDAINVPPYDRDRSSIFVSGDIPFPGDYDFRQDDTILDILAIATGNLGLQSDRVIRLIRRNPDGTLVTENFTPSSLGDSTAGAPVLRPLDRINIPPLRGRGVAAADGWLQYPGQYPIEVGVTTLVDLINLAGGFHEEALIRGSYLERNAAYGRGVEFANAVVPSSGRFEILTDSSAALWQMRLGEFDFFSRQFLARWLKMNRRVSVDVPAATQPGAAPVFLQDGDRLFVPKDENSVYVIGEVVRPGRTPVAAGYSAEDYIATVGGRGPRADNTYVIKAGSGQVLPAGAPVYSGDYLFVDRAGGESASIESERLLLMRKEQKTRSWSIVLGALATSAAVITTTILVIEQLRK